jgi:hypothetical protein
MYGSPTSTRPGDCSRAHAGPRSTLLNGFVRGTVSGVQERATAERVTGITEDQWWTAMAPHAERFFDAERLPTERSLEFGLERLLDGPAS